MLDFNTRLRRLEGRMQALEDQVQTLWLTTDRLRGRVEALTVEVRGREVKMDHPLSVG